VVYEKGDKKEEIKRGRKAEIRELNREREREMRGKRKKKRKACEREKEN